MVIGITHRNEKNPIYAFNPKKGSFAYWEPEIKGKGIIGVAVLAPKQQLHLNSSAAKQFLLQTLVKNQTPLTYYAGGVWNKAGKITSAEAWTDYIEQFEKNRSKPLKIKLK